MPVTINDIHREIKNHIANNPNLGTRIELEYGSTLIKPEDVITRTYYIEEGIVKAQAHGRWLVATLL